MKFEAYKSPSGDYRWRLRSDDGTVIAVRPGRIMGIKSSPSQAKASKRAVNQALARLAGEGKHANRSGAGHAASSPKA